MGFAHVARQEGNVQINTTRGAKNEKKIFAFNFILSINHYYLNFYLILFENIALFHTIEHFGMQMHFIK